MRTKNPPKMQIDNVILRMDDDLLNRKTNLDQSGSKLPIWFFPPCYWELFKSDLTLLFKTVDNVPNHHLMAFYRRLRRSWNGICSETKTKISRLGNAKDDFFSNWKCWKETKTCFPTTQWAPVRTMRGSQDKRTWGQFTVSVLRLYEELVCDRNQQDFDEFFNWNE